MLPPADMAFGASLGGDGTAERATVMAVPLAQYSNLRRALRLVGWRHAEVTVLPVALAGPGDEAEHIRASLLVGPRWVDFVVCRDRSIVLLRRLAGTVPGAPRPEPDLAAVSGELRLSLGQLPEAVRRQLRRIAIIGSRDPARKLHAELSSTAPAGVRLELQEMDGETTLLAHVADRAAYQARNGKLALTLAPITVAAKPHGIRWSRRQLAWGAGLVLLLGGTLVGLGLRQQRQLNRLQASWHAMEPRTQTVREILAQAKARAPWLSDEPLSLDILRAVTLAFPEHGTIWTTRVQTKGRTEVTVSGKALNREAWLQVLEALRQSPGVRDLRVSQLREASDGKAPMSFALSFTWHTPPTNSATPEVTP